MRLRGWTPGPVVGWLPIAVAGVLLFGIFPEPLVASIQASAQYLP